MYLGPSSPPSKLVGVLVARDPTVALEPVTANCEDAAGAEVETPRAPREVLGHSLGALPPFKEVAQAQGGVRKDEHRRLRRENPVSQPLQQKVEKTAERSHFAYVVVTLPERKRDTISGAAGDCEGVACTAWPRVGHSGAVREADDGTGRGVHGELYHPLFRRTSATAGDGETQQRELCDPACSTRAGEWGRECGGKGTFIPHSKVKREHKKREEGRSGGGETKEGGMPRRGKRHTRALCSYSTRILNHPTAKKDVTECVAPHPTQKARERVARGRRRPAGHIHLCLPPPHVKWKRVEDEAQKQIPYRRRCLGRDQARIAAELDERSRHLVRGEPATELLMQGGGLGGELPRHPIAARRQVLIDEAAALRWASRRWEVLEVDGPVQSRSPPWSLMD